ncbi:MAG: hypothetical protein OHK0053_24330 [Microscillaceae bacterium]
MVDVLWLSAHEFWLQPTAYRLAVGDTLRLDLMVGEGFVGERWAKRTERSKSLWLYGDKEAKDLSALVKANDSLRIETLMPKAGTYLLAFESNNSFLALEADKFNDYLREDGIEDILALRTQNQQLELPSREWYRRCAKALVQVGKKTSPVFQKVVGMDLEIVPLRNPYANTKEDNMQGKLLYLGQALANKAFFTWHKAPGKPTRKEKYYTDAQGRFSFPLDQPGEWMVSCVHMVEVPDNPEANYQSYWATLTFAF